VLDQSGVPLWVNPDAVASVADLAPQAGVPAPMARLFFRDGDKTLDILDTAEGFARAVAS
jgi:hypothetical protein